MNISIKAALLAAVIAAGGVSGQVAELAEAAVYEKAESNISEKDVQMCAKLVWGEARGCTETEQSAVIWCVLNRVDAGYGGIAEVITARGQFYGYRASNPVTDELYELAEDVLTRYYLEKSGVSGAGRTLPKDYLWFTGDGRHNYFRNEYRGGTYWDWSLPSPYID